MIHNEDAQGERDRAKVNDGRRSSKNGVAVYYRHQHPSQAERTGWIVNEGKSRCVPLPGESGVM